MLLTALAAAEVVSRTLDGVTVGQVVREVNWASKGQVDRALKQLETDGMCWSEMVPYARTGKRVYRLTEHAAIMFAAIARQYTESCGA